MLFWKELRESLRSLPLAMLVLGLFLYLMMPDRGAIVDLATILSYVIAILGSVYALLLAVLQLWPEQRTDVRGWMLSQPVPRARIFWAKTIAAFLVHALALAVPGLVAFVWLSSEVPESRAADLRGFVAMTLAYIASFSFYLGSVWMMCRPARWIGSKTIPLTIPLLSVFGSVLAVTQAILFTTQWTLVCLGVVAIAVILIISARHAYVSLSDQSSQWATEFWDGRLTSFGLVVSVASIVIAAGHIALEGWIMPLTYPEQPNMDFQFSKDGDWVWTRNEYRWQPEEQSSYYVPVAAKRMKSIDLADASRPIELPRPDWDSLSDFPLKEVGDQSWVRQPWHLGGGTRAVFHPLFRGVHRRTHHSEIAGLNWVYHDDGFYYLYAPTLAVEGDDPLLVAKLGRNGFGGTTDAAELEHFNGGDPLATFLGNSTGWVRAGKQILVDHDGVYQVSLVDQSIRVVTKSTIDEFYMSGHLGTHGPTAVLFNKRTNKLDLYDVLSDEVNREIPLPPRPADEKMNDPWAPDKSQKYWPLIKLVKRKELQLPSTNMPDSWVNYRLIDLRDDGFVLTRSSYQFGMETIYVGSNETIKSTQFTRLPGRVSPSVAELACGAIAPPVISAYTGYPKAMGKQWRREPAKNPTAITVTWILGMVIHLVLGIVLTLWATGMRKLPRPIVRRWLMLTPLLGCITPLAVWCLHARVATEECASCGVDRRVDEIQCSGCQESWLEPEPLGIEVLSA